MRTKFFFLLLICTVLPAALFANGGPRHFQALDVFDLELSADPQISPDGTTIVYVRTFFDIMTDRRRSNLWTVRFDGSRHRPLTTGNENDSSPRWSPDGTRLVYISSSDGSTQLYLRWLDTQQTAKLTNLTHAPQAITWSPDGKWLAFSMFVPTKAKPFADMPDKPKGAKWAPSPKYITKLTYRFDGRGYLEDGYSHLFVLSTEGGTPRQLTSGAFNDGGPLAWSPDGEFLIFSGNRHEEWQYEPVESDIYEVSVKTGDISALTDRVGPDRNPVVSPDGKKIAYVGFDDHLQGYEVVHLYVMNRDGSGIQNVTEGFDRSVARPSWSHDNKNIYFQYDDRGDTKVAATTLSGKVTDLVSGVGGLTLGRPYAGGTYSVSGNGRVAYTYSRPDRPADVGVIQKGTNRGKRLTSLNEDLLGSEQLGAIEEIWFESSFDQRKIQGWVMTPPAFDANKKYPLILEIHGGPFANYGGRFSAELQLYAAAGYVVLYLNPRGSTSYGEEFGNLIHHNYPGEDYDDLMSGVDAVTAKGFIDENRLFVTGGSGGGVLSAWIVGKTGRFSAAAVAKPVINWYSFVLTSDAYNFFYKYWFPGYPWDYPDQYLKRSPLSNVGQVTTPTLLMTGEADYRTPISESEQFYQALKLRKIDTALVRIPEASHGITRRPSHLIAKVNHILKWFEKHGGTNTERQD